MEMSAALALEKVDSGTAAAEEAMVRRPEVETMAQRGCSSQHMQMGCRRCLPAAHRKTKPEAYRSCARYPHRCCCIAPEEAQAAAQAAGLAAGTAKGAAVGASAAAAKEVAAREARLADMMAERGCSSQHMEMDCRRQPPVAHTS